ncbi:glycosyltransferase [Belliella sp. R4-6]|uniref:Glycosyltransferase n=1 Tax=Belliella alkalica TaxID=1730871 RepID=A0ABS9VBF5_9BACT|nr:glycosyltransferase [Belliella alkalica]MCH7413767.1 glycosyltransferase [Belliella alkalica]
MFFSVIIPVYNRPQEIHELLNSLLAQEEKYFEVLIIEDGSEFTCKQIVEQFQDRLNIRYFFISNVGQGFARNYGMKQAFGDYFVLFDSDCIIPSHYFSNLRSAIIDRKLDAFGGPDAAGHDFSDFQKAMNYSMTSVFTTGGIRGKLKDPSKYQARGYNMGLSKEAFECSKGFVDPNKGEDIELSIRLKKLGYKLELVEGAFVYHKRKSTLLNFFKQSFSFGQNRINVSRYHSEAVKLIHLMPVFFLIFVSSLLMMLFVLPVTNLLFIIGVVILGLWKTSIFFHASIVNKSIKIGIISIITSVGQLSAYGLGMITEGLKKVFKG